MRHYFGIYKQKIRERRMSIWRYAGESEDKVTIQREDKSFTNDIIYLKELTEKMNQMFPDGRFACKMEVLDKDFKKTEVDYIFIYEHEGKLAESQVTVYIEDNYSFETKTTYLDEDWYFNTSFSNEETKRVEEAILQEVKNLNKYRLHFLFK